MTRAERKARADSRRRELFIEVAERAANVVEGGGSARDAVRSVDRWVEEARQLKPQEAQMYRDVAFHYVSELRNYPHRKKEAGLHALIAEYHRNTEAYDRTVCTGPIHNGGILPANPDEKFLCDVNALKEQGKLVVAAGELGFTQEEVRKAMGRFRPEFEKEDRGHEDERL